MPQSGSRAPKCGRACIAPQKGIHHNCCPNRMPDDDVKLDRLREMQARERDEAQAKADAKARAKAEAKAQKGRVEVRRDPLANSKVWEAVP